MGEAWSSAFKGGAEVKVLPGDLAETWKPRQRLRGAGGRERMRGSRRERVEKPGERGAPGKRGSAPAGRRGRGESEAPGREEAECFPPTRLGFL